MLAGRLLGERGGVREVLNTRGYNTENYSTEGLLSCKSNGYWTIVVVAGNKVFDAQ